MKRKALFALIVLLSLFSVVACDEFNWYECKFCKYFFLKPSEGIIYQASADDTYAVVTGYTGTATRIVIADTYNGLPVRSIYNSAFENANITSVFIPDSVKNIGVSAFANCESLTSVNIPDGVTSISDDAFSNCHPSLYTEYEFGRYVGDKNKPFKVLIEITNKSLATYNINENTEIISNGAFEDCTKLTGINIPDRVTTICPMAFADCNRLTSVTIPDSITSIGDAAFSSCRSLTSVTIPDSVTSIGMWAFYDCGKLTSVTIPDSVTSIGVSAFHSCGSLTSVTIPDSLTSISAFAFNDCTNLTSVTIPDSITSIGTYAFDGCNSLTSITIPDSVTSIGVSAFDDCNSLTSVKFENPDGWNVDGTSISSEDLQDKAKAAEYLRITYCTKDWIRK